MTNETYRVIKRNLNLSLKKNKVYLDKSISLIKLSIELGTNTYYLSKVINESFEMNFKTLINKHRIEYCKKIIKRNTAHVVPAEKLAEMSGFSSVSVFYRVFQQETHTTPQKYRHITTSNETKN